MARGASGWVLGRSAGLGERDERLGLGADRVGARDGVQGLPPAWLERLLDADAIRTEAEALVPLAQAR